ncbi:cysteine/glutathione ABC transporter ATP-binding protein/permease CydC [Vibrio gazogenes]|uniref:Glutathione/L-cysteine transport system ATP-binding/permease protein CydC n=1 Tax=Vibrio gazogenes DSM 21264 = NBRC 103151 TaxID=1123492 RepID=A0A1M4YLE0_VIBGA|nr:cysteine/glutathione ABC transporter ATP-binding protein/permease CydC [Vibrio gazogenes]USP15025.1 cysteine/glutathione ABC transporter ATP-binding protein/permease CydC [Vibrio gazogenes]SHF06635.1 ATP-binding cassette, subfamily C, CydC [Vibrio gazogenes DSM 21264] [Vibrio gazogenes DSM 21264 = NBRC 103151]SJN56475.1 putative ABC transporter ATP-binding protein [Vibrio gazogenes]
MRDLIPFLKLYKKHWFGLTLGIILSFLTLCASIGLLTLSGWFLSAAAVAGLTIARQSFNYMLPSAFVRGFAIGRTAGRWGERVVSHNATFKVLADLRIFFFKKLSPLIPGRIANLRDADLLNRLVADVDAMDHVYLRLISPVMVGILGVLVLSAFLYWFDPMVGLTLGAIMLVLLLSWPVLFYKLGKRNGAALTQSKANLRVTLLDWIQGYSELTIFGAEPTYRQAIMQDQQDLISRQYINTRYSGFAQALLMLASGWTLVFMLWFVANGVGQAGPDPMIAMVAFATMASFELLMPIAGAFQHLGQTLTSARRLNEVLSSEPEVTFQTEPTQHNGQFDIRFEQVNFHYPDHQQQRVLNEIDLHIPAGHKVAIVGQTGSGKSTLLQLISRYWDPSQGQVSIAGTDLKHWNEHDLRACMSIVSQRVDILNGTLRENLQIAAPDADDMTYTQVLSQVGLDKLLDGPGLNVWLGDGGRHLSGGEKRRLGIARALLHQGEILLLDEPTEGLDKQTERQIMDLLRTHYAHKTVIFITHRLIELERMDAICLIEQGQIVEYGSHEALIAQQGRYHALNQTL